MQHLVVEMRESDLSRFYTYWKCGMYELRTICNATILCLGLTIKKFTIQMPLCTVLTQMLEHKTLVYDL